MKCFMPKIPKCNADDSDNDGGGGGDDDDDGDGKKQKRLMVCEEYGSDFERLFIFIRQTRAWQLPMFLLIEFNLLFVAFDRC